MMFDVTRVMASPLPLSIQTTGASLEIVEKTTFCRPMMRVASQIKCNVPSYMTCFSVTWFDMSGWNERERKGWVSKRAKGGGSKRAKGGKGGK